MRIYFRKVTSIIKAMIIAMVLIVILLIGICKPELPRAQQTFDLRTSAAVSLGFGTSLCLLIQDSRKR